MKGFFGNFGGQYVPKEVLRALNELEEAYEKIKDDKSFIEEYSYYLKNYVGRESPLYFARNLTKKCGGAKIYLKREDLNHTGAHKINNAIAQALLAKRMGKKRIIAETGAGQHGVATATVCALLGLECDIFMGEEDTQRQMLNVKKMKLLGANVTAVTQGTKTLRDAVDKAFEEWVKRIDDTFYLIGSAVGPHPYPEMVRDFQRVIGDEARNQILQKEGRLPDYLLACVGGGSNAIGLFYPFINDKEVKIIGLEAAGKGVDTDMNAATMTKGNEGIIHGMNTIVLKDDEGNILPAYSISPGLDYPGVGPEHAYLKKIGRAEYIAVSDEEAMTAFRDLSRLEGIIPAVESSHAVYYGMKLAKSLSEDRIIIINLSGRGDKDMN